MPVGKRGSPCRSAPSRSSCGIDGGDAPEQVRHAVGHGRERDAVDDHGRCRIRRGEAMRRTKAVNRQRGLERHRHDRAGERRFEKRGDVAVDGAQHPLPLRLADQRPGRAPEAVETELGLAARRGEDADSLGRPVGCSNQERGPVGTKGTSPIAQGLGEAGERGGRDRHGANVHDHVLAAQAVPLAKLEPHRCHPAAPERCAAP